MEVQYISTICHVCWMRIILTDHELQHKEFQVCGENNWRLRLNASSIHFVRKKVLTTKQP